VRFYRQQTAAFTPTLRHRAGTRSVGAERAAQRESNAIFSHGKETQGEPDEVTMHCTGAFAKGKWYNNTAKRRELPTEI